MADRPIGDDLDRRLRAGVSVIVQGADVVESLDDLLSFTPDTGEDDMLMKAKTRSENRVWLAVEAVVIVVMGVVGVALISADGGSDQADEGPDLVTEGLDAPAALIAAESYAVDPSGTRLADLLDAIGGLEALELTEITGGFDIMSFDPGDNSRILGSERDEFRLNRYAAQNQDDNVIFDLTDPDAEPEPFTPGMVHDSVNFQPDGSVTMLYVADEVFNSEVRGRNVRLFDAAGNVVLESEVEHNFARWTANDGVVAYLAAPGVLSISPSLLVESAAGPLNFGIGDGINWVQAPAPGIIVVTGSRGSYVLDTGSLELVDDHPLAGLEIARVAVSGDGSVAVTIDRDGNLATIDMSSGAVGDAFGSVAVDFGVCGQRCENVAVPLALNGDGSVAVTTEMDGTVTLWHVPSGEAVIRFASDAHQHRDLWDVNSTRITSAVAVDASRVARLNPASGPEGATWTIIDTDVDSGISRACQIAGRSLTADEKAQAGLPDGPGVCG